MAQRYHARFRLTSMEKIYGLSLVLLLAFLLTSGCTPENEDPDFDVLGAKPVYSTLSVGDQVYDTPRPFSSLSRFVVREDIIFVIETGEGVHILDNSDPANPINLGFIIIPGASNIAVDGNYIFANLGVKLIVIRFVPLIDAEIVSITGGLSPDGANMFPPNFSGFFECVDTDKGDVVDWRITTLTNPKCRL